MFDFISVAISSSCVIKVFPGIKELNIQHELFLYFVLSAKAVSCETCVTDMELSGAPMRYKKNLSIEVKKDICNTKTLLKSIEIFFILQLNLQSTITK